MPSCVGAFRQDQFQHILASLLGSLDLRSVPIGDPLKLGLLHSPLGRGPAKETPCFVLAYWHMSGQPLYSSLHRTCTPVLCAAVVSELRTVRRNPLAAMIGLRNRTANLLLSGSCSSVVSINETIA